MQSNYSEFVAALVKSPNQIVEEMTPHKAHIMHMAIGVAGEAGELMDAIKKCAIYNKEVDINNVIEELGDLEFFMEGLRQCTGITREQTIEHNVAKLSKRYSSGSYSNKQAQERADKESK